MTDGVAPQHGKCQRGRWWNGGRLLSEDVCPDRAIAGSVYCAPCRAAALARLPDRSIGDASLKPLRWSGYATYLSRGSG